MPRDGSLTSSGRAEAVKPGRRSACPFDAGAAGLIFAMSPFFWNPPAWVIALTNSDTARQAAGMLLAYQLGFGLLVASAPMHKGAGAEPAVKSP